jgi:predicted peroxiredoxin
VLAGTHGEPAVELFLCSAVTLGARQLVTREENTMANKAVISLTTGLEDPEKVTVAYLVAVGAAESGRDTLMFLTKEAVRLGLAGVAIGVACDGCPPLADLVKRYEAAGGRYFVCPVCFNAKQLDDSTLIAGAEIQGTIPMWEWIGDGATTFSY